MRGPWYYDNDVDPWWILADCRAAKLAAFKAFTALCEVIMNEDRL